MGDIWITKDVWITKDTKTHEIHERVSRPFASFRDLRDPNALAPFAIQTLSPPNNLDHERHENSRNSRKSFAPFRELSRPSRSKRPPRRTIWITKDTKTHEIHERVSRPFASFRDLRDPNALPAKQSGSRNTRTLSRPFARFRDLRDPNALVPFAIQMPSRPSRSKPPSPRKDRANAPSTLEKRLPLRTTIQRHHPRLH